MTIQLIEEKIGTKRQRMEALEYGRSRSWPADSHECDVAKPSW